MSSWLIHSTDTLVSKLNIQSQVLIVFLSDLLMSAYQPSGLADQSHLEIFNFEFRIGLKHANYF